MTAPRTRFYLAFHPFYVILLLALSTGFELRAQSVPTAAVVVELEALRVPYVKTLTAFQAARGARCEPTRRTYLAALERLEKETAPRPELDPSQSIKAERERMAAKMEPGAEDRKAMMPALSALRIRYEGEIQRVAGPSIQQELQLTRQYVNSLDGLQRRLIATNQMQKAALVRTERENAALLLPAEVKPETGKTPAASTVHAQGKLDPALADKIAAAVQAKGYTRTDDSSESGEKPGWADIPDSGALLVGFEFFEVNARDGAWIRSLRPYFMTRDGVISGKDRGKMEKVTSKVLARPGYAVAGLLTFGAKSFQVVFMKIDPISGAFDPAPSNSYKSTWYGAKRRGTPKQVGGDGHLIIGVYGKTGSDCDTIGLVENN